jgi:hypothetical protein
MTPYQSELERAFEPARSGKYTGLYGLIQQVVKKGYSGRQIIGRTLRRQLLELMANSRWALSENALKPKSDIQGGGS